MKYTATLQWYKVIIDTDEGTITGETYEARKIIKQEFEGIKWDGARKAWTMEPAKMAKIVADMTPYFTRVFKLSPIEPEAQPEAVEAKAEPEAVEPAEAADQLPELRGSAKQTAWAEDIRKSFLQQLEAEQAKMVSEHPETASTYEAIRLAVNTITEAGWWIDHRTVKAAMLVLREVKVTLADGSETTSAEAARQAAAKMEAGKPDDDPDNTPDGNPTAPTDDTPTDPASPSAPEQGQGGSTSTSINTDAMEGESTMKQIITRQVLGELRLAGKRNEANAITGRLTTAKETLEQAYVDHYNEPVKVTVNSLIDSLGYDGAVAAVAEALTHNLVIDDPRISRKVNAWAAVNTDVDDDIAIRFCLTQIHPCNLGLIAETMMDTERPAEQAESQADNTDARETVEVEPTVEPTADAKSTSAEVLKQIKQGFANAKRDCTNARKAFEAGDGDKAIRLASRAHDVIDDIRAYYDNKLSVAGNEYEDIARDVARLLEDKEEYKYVAIGIIEDVYKAAAEQADANTDAMAEGEGVNPPCPPCQGGSEDTGCQVENEDEPTAEPMVGPMDEPVDDAHVTFEPEPVDDARVAFGAEPLPTVDEAIVQLQRVLQRRLDEADGVAVGNARFPLMAGWVAREIEAMTEGLGELTPDTVEDLTAMVSLLIELSDALGIGSVDDMLGECENASGPIPDALVLPVTYADEYNISLLAGRYPEAVKTNGVLYAVKWGELVKAVKRAEDVRSGKAEARRLKAEAKRERFDARLADGKLPMVDVVLESRTCTITADADSMRIIVSFRKKPTRKATEACKAAKFRYDASGKVWVRSLKVKAWREAMNLMATLDAAA